MLIRANNLSARYKKAGKAVAAVTGIDPNNPLVKMLVIFTTLGGLLALSPALLLSIPYGSYLWSKTNDADKEEEKVLLLTDGTLPPPVNHEEAGFDLRRASAQTKNESVAFEQHLIKDVFKSDDDAWRADRAARGFSKVVGEPYVKFVEPPAPLGSIPSFTTFSNAGYDTEESCDSATEIYPELKMQSDGSFVASKFLNSEEELDKLDEILSDCEEMFLQTHVDSKPESRFIDKVPRGAQLEALRHGKVEAVLRDYSLNTDKNVIYSSTPDFDNVVKNLEGDWHKVYLNGNNFAAIRKPQNMPGMDWMFLIDDVSKALDETMSDEDRQKLKDAKLAKAAGSKQTGNSSDQRPNSQMKGKGGGGKKGNYDRSKRTANFDDDESQHYRRDTGGFGGQAESRRDQFHSFEDEVERGITTDSLLKKWELAKTKLGSLTFDPSHWLSRVHMDKEYHIPVPKDAFNQITLANLNRAVKHPLFNLISVTDQRTVANSIAGSVKLANKAERDAKAKDPKKKVPSKEPKKKPSKAPGKKQPKKAVKLEPVYNNDLNVIPPRVYPESRIVEGELVTKSDRACLIAIHSAVDGRFISMGFRFTSECYLTTMHTFTNVPGIKNFVFGGGYPKSDEYVMSCLKDGVVNGTDEYVTFDRSNVVTSAPMSAVDLDYTGLAIIHGTKHPKGVRCGKLDVSAEILPGIIMVVNPIKPGSDLKETPGNTVEHGRRLFAHLSPTFCDRGSSGLPIKGILNDNGICGMHVGSEAVVTGVRQNLAIDLMSAASRLEVENLLASIPTKN
jgi:hypothetical protein